MNKKTKDLPYIGTDCVFPNVKACGAKKRKQSALCRQPAMVNGRCRFHGGKSTGAKTEEGKKRSKTAALKHGYYSEDAKQQNAEMRQFLKECNMLLPSMKQG